jgi:hypothetical protein
MAVVAVATTADESSLLAAEFITSAIFSCCRAPSAIFTDVAESNKERSERSWCLEGVPQLPAVGRTKAFALASPKMTAPRGT